MRQSLDSIIIIVAKLKISRLLLASEAEQAGLRHTWTQTPGKDRFSRDMLKLSPKIHSQKSKFNTYQPALEITVLITE